MKIFEQDQFIRIFPKTTWILKVVQAFFCFCIISCDCWTDGNGVVVDSITRQPIDSVIAKSYAGDTSRISHLEMMTDSTGQFSGTTGNTGRCMDLIIRLSKNGYHIITVTNPKDDTVKMVKK